MADANAVEAKPRKVFGGGAASKSRAALLKGSKPKDFRALPLTRAMLAISGEESRPTTTLASSKAEERATVDIEELEELRAENAALRKILDDIQTADQINTENMRNNKSVSLDDYFDWLKDLLRGYGHGGDVVMLVNEFLSEIDHSSWQIDVAMGDNSQVDDFDVVQELFKSHPELEDHFHIWIQAFLEAEVEKLKHQKQERRNTIKRRMSLIDMSAKASMMFDHISGLLRGRAESYSIMAAHYPMGLLEQGMLRSFYPKGGLEQKEMESFAELYSTARDAKAKLSEILTKLMREKLSLDPDEVMLAEGDGGEDSTSWTALGFDLMAEEECREEMSRGDSKKMLDVLKAWVIIKDETDLSDFVELLKMGAMKGMRVLKLKNSFADFNFTGMGNFVAHVEVSLEGEKKFVASIRVEASHIFSLKREPLIQAAHTVLGTYFEEETTEDTRSKLHLFDRLHGEGVKSGLSLAQVILCGEDEGRLVALDEVSTLIGEHAVVLKCRKKLLQLAEKRGASEELRLRMLDGLSSTARHLEMFEEAADYANKAVEGKKRLLGETHIETLQSMRMVAKLTTW